jgi:hypothetical protein
MARPSKLTDYQWSEIKRRLLSGEKAADLSREFKISKATITERVTKRIELNKAVANQMVTAEVAFRSLPISEQFDVNSIMDNMKAVLFHTSASAKYGAATSHRLSGIAHGKVQLIDDAAPISPESMESLKGIAVLTRMANESAEIGLNLIKANKEMMNDKGEDNKFVIIGGLPI